MKREGYTQAVLSVLLAQKELRLFIPYTAKREIISHLREISRKSGLPETLIRNFLNLILSHIESVDEMEFREHLIQVLGYVNDKKDSPFCGLAIKHAPSIILTYNKKDYMSEKLKTFMCWSLSQRSW